jgi:hypothetical protein
MDERDALPLMFKEIRQSVDGNELTSSAGCRHCHPRCLCAIGMMVTFYREEAQLRWPTPSILRPDRG